MRWEKGRDRIEEMLNGQPPRLQKVVPSREHADRLVRQARAHLTTAARVADDDPSGAYGMLYDAARKALTAVLQNQGLRPTTRGGHLAAYDAVTAQLDPPLGKTLRPFNRLRRTRNSAEYRPHEPTCGHTAPISTATPSEPVTAGTATAAPSAQDPDGAPSR
jgi:hypothetical protein